MTQDELTRRMEAQQALISQMAAQLDRIHGALFPTEKASRRQQIAAAKAQILTKHNKAQ